LFITIVKSSAKKEEKCSERPMTIEKDWCKWLKQIARAQSWYSLHSTRITIMRMSLGTYLWMTALKWNPFAHLRTLSLIIKKMKETKAKDQKVAHSAPNSVIICPSLRSFPTYSLPLSFTPFEDLGDVTNRNIKWIYILYLFYTLTLQSHQTILIFIFHILE
jgi:hypothetical protein